MDPRSEAEADSAPGAAQPELTPTPTEYVVPSNGGSESRSNRAFRERSAMLQRAQPTPQSRLGPEEQIALLDLLRKSGDIGAACRLVGTTTAACRERARRDPEFAAALAEAREDYKDEVLLPEAQRRAVEGVVRRVYYKGEQATNKDGSPAEQMEFSDAILLRLLEVYDHRFRPRSVHELRQAPVEARDLDLLTPEARAKAEELLALIAQASTPTPPQLLPPAPQLEQPPVDAGAADVS